ncbi:MAG: 3-hydroxyacyl-CoA dehydrogenase family protein [Desulfomonilaceae bacterium]
MDAGNVGTVLVIGAGVMGHSIAQVFAQAGIEVDLTDLNEQALTRAMTLIRTNLHTLAEFGRVPQNDIPVIMARIRPSTDLTASARKADFVLEAVSEVPEIKRAVFGQLDEICPQDTVLASNTSSLNIFEIARVKSPERLIVAHWFAPPHIIPLVEVVPGPDTDARVVTFTADLMRRLGKKPLILEKFVPSFIVNRIQNSIGKAVWEMLENEWATPEQIDLAVKASLGIRLPIVGVVQSVDFTGLDLVSDIMRSHDRIVPLVEEKVKQGQLGAKTSKGIYDYGGRTEEEILIKRDKQYLKMLEHLEKIQAFDPV